MHFHLSITCVLFCAESSSRLRVWIALTKIGHYVQIYGFQHSAVQKHVKMLGIFDGVDW